jgi:ferric-dicitrate binding protein FerR (iron transport regulator)
MKSGDYLWDRSGDPDLDVVRMEKQLASLRLSEGEIDALVVEAQPVRRRRHARWAAGAGIAVAAAAAALLFWPRAGSAPGSGSGSGSRSVSASGSGSDMACSTDEAGLAVRIEGDEPRDAHLAVGEWLEVGARSRALLDLAGLGEVQVGPDSRVRIASLRDDEKRLELARGVLHAVVSAPPRLFLVDLPSATAVDLGCEYELVVDEHGAGTLRVELGEVALEGHGRSSLVRAGSIAETRPGHGPGTPYRDGAPPALIAALRSFDFEHGGGAALDAILAASGKGDEATLEHLLDRTSGEEHSKVAGRLTSLDGKKRVTHW